MPSWNPDLYMKFANERTQPSRDLAARIHLQTAQSILDIGCGPGNSTGVIAKRYPHAKTVLGVDSSAAMVAAAKTRYPAFEFRQWDANGLLSPLGSFDVVFSNACLQWLPNHEALLPRMMDCVNEGGVLAVQIPVNQDEPIQTIIAALALEPPYHEYLQNEKPFTRLTAAQYYDILAPISRAVRLWQTTYYHKMDSHAAIVEWYKGTGLRPYLEGLPEGLATEFEAETLRRVQKAYPAQADGSVLFPFPRLFFAATK